MTARASRTRARNDVGAVNESRDEARVVRTASGASAEVSGELVLLRDRKGAVVVVFDAETGSAEIVAPDGDLSLSAPGGKIRLRAPEIVCEAGKLEIDVERVVERAKDVYREVEGLLQTRAGRVRQIVHDTYRVLAKRVHIAAEEDAAVDGKRVLLG